MSRADRQRVTARPKCQGGCGGRHVTHDGPCARRGRSRCQPLPGGGVMCGYRPPCPCPWRECKCGLPLAVAVELPAGAAFPPDGAVMLVSVVRGSAGLPGGTLAVWQLANGMLGCRDLPPGENPGPGEWRGTEHAEDRCGTVLAVRGG